ncbi:MAG: hypothetical protein ACFFAO_12960, partial [Candidatus Hermodarchaeota archaeon]
SEKDWIPTPVKKNEDPADDIILDDAYFVHMDSHLICHSDAEGYYIPLNFKDVIYDDDRDRILGGMLGSSYMLFEELLKIAPKLGIKIQENKIDPKEIDVINSIKDEEPFSIEKRVWLVLYDCAELSIKYKSLIRFS